MIQFFGYAVQAEKADHAAFFDYGSDAPSGFNQHNEQHLNWIKTLTTQQRAEIQYDLGDMTKDITIVDDLKNHPLAYQDFVER